MTDWANHVISSKAELIWKVDREAIKKAAYVRVKTKCVPRFSAWIEVLDPCHRNLWRALDFDTTVNHYQKYDLHSQIPCPDTRAKALIDKAYGVRRSTPRDQGTDLRVAQRTPSNRNPPPIGAGTNTAQLRWIFEKDERANVRRNLYNNQNSSPGNTGNGPPGEQSDPQHQAAGGVPPPNLLSTQPTLPPSPTPLLPTLPTKGSAKEIVGTSLLTGLPIEASSNIEDDDFLGLSTQGTEQTEMQDTGTSTPVLSITPVEEDDEL